MGVRTINTYFPKRYRSGAIVVRPLQYAVPDRTLVLIHDTIVIDSSAGSSISEQERTQAETEQNGTLALDAPTNAPTELLDLW